MDNDACGNEDKFPNPQDCANEYWWRFMLTSHSSDSVEDDWMMFCMSDGI